MVFSVFANTEIYLLIFYLPYKNIYIINTSIRKLNMRFV